MEDNTQDNILSFEGALEGLKNFIPIIRDSNIKDIYAEYEKYINAIEKFKPITVETVEIQDPSTSTQVIDNEGVPFDDYPFFRRLFKIVPHLI